MKSNIVISGTSFLLPKNSAWNSLSPSDKLIFSESGECSKSIIKCKDNEYLILVIFVSDLYKPSSKLQCNNKTILNLTETLLNVIEKRIKKSYSPTIVAISSWKLESIIRQTGNENFSLKIFDHIMNRLGRLKSSSPNLYLIDLDKQFGYHGFVNTFDSRNWYLAHCRLSIDGLNVLTNTLTKVIDRIKKPAKKVLVLDCDNTLWGGVIGEEGISGIILGLDGLGSAFTDFQYSAKKLKDEGILLALCSKNNEKDVWEVFTKHQSMILKKKDITAYKINWKDKTQNLVELSHELDLDLNSFVYWDDNPIEREKMKKILPQVLTVEPSKNVAQWSGSLDGMDCFAKFNITNEDKKKTKQYQIRTKFTKDVKSEIDEISFLKSIKLKAKAIPINESTIKRASQLSMKTNQFNLRTIRYTEREIEELKINNNKDCFLVNLNDIYGDHGLVGFVCTKKIDPKTIFLENFLMSCRVFGRHLEAWMFNQIIKRAKKNNYQYIVAEYIPTQKNIIAKNCLADHGFVKYNKLKNKDILKINLRNYTRAGNIFIVPVKKMEIPFIEIYGKN